MDYNIKDLYIGIIKENRSFGTEHHSIWSKPGYLPIFEYGGIYKRDIFCYVLNAKGFLIHTDEYKRIAKWDGLITQ